MVSNDVVNRMRSIRKNHFGQMKDLGRSAAREDLRLEPSVTILGKTDWNFQIDWEEEGLAAVLGKISGVRILVPFEELYDKLLGDEDCLIERPVAGSAEWNRVCREAAEQLRQAVTLHARKPTPLVQRLDTIDELIASADEIAVAHLRQLGDDLKSLILRPFARPAMDIFLRGRELFERVRVEHRRQLVFASLKQQRDELHQRLDAVRRRIDSLETDTLKAELQEADEQLRHVLDELKLNRSETIQQHIEEDYFEFDRNRERHEAFDDDDRDIDNYDPYANT